MHRCKSSIPTEILNKYAHTEVHSYTLTNTLTNGGVLYLVPVLKYSTKFEYVLLDISDEDVIYLMLLGWYIGKVPGNSHINDKLQKKLFIKDIWA